MPLPLDHAARMQRASLSLDGLSVGDAFGEGFFGDPERVEHDLARRRLPPAPWWFTDDTVMALSVVEVLGRAGGIDPELLASAFARRYAAEPARGYGGTAHGILQAIGSGVPWRMASSRAFDGAGSMGNGAAMRVAPVGAYFADNLDLVVENARASAAVTHAHPDGQAGAVAVAVAAAVAWRMGTGAEARSSRGLLEAAFERTPEGETKEGLARALDLPLEYAVDTAASVLGTGSRVVSWDTVPFALWCAARHVDDFHEALWTTVAGLGDRDTTCAIVGGVVALSAGRAAIPAEWLEAREPFDE